LGDRIVSKISEIKKQLTALERKLKKEIRTDRISKLPKEIQKCLLCKTIALAEYEYNLKYIKFKCPVCKKKTKMIDGVNLHCTKCHWDSAKEKKYKTITYKDDVNKTLSCTNCNAEVERWDSFFIGAWKQTRTVCPSCAKADWWEIFIRSEDSDISYSGRDGAFDRW
jgi:hypothetical protein